MLNEIILLMQKRIGPRPSILHAFKTMARRMEIGRAPVTLQNGAQATRSWATQLAFLVKIEK